jgi:hypothetical protein
MTKRTILATAIVAATLLATASTFNVIVSPGIAFAADSSVQLATKIAAALKTLPANASSAVIQAKIRDVLMASDASPSDKQTALAVVQSKASGTGTVGTEIAMAAQMVADQTSTNTAPAVSPNSRTVVALANQMTTTFTMNGAPTGGSQLATGGGGLQNSNNLGNQLQTLLNNNKNTSGVPGGTLGTVGSPPQAE